MKNTKWIIFIFVLTFVLAAAFSGATVMLSDINVALMIVILCVVVALGIVCDMMGVAVLSANEATFHAMASKKIKGAKESVALLRSAPKVSSICNDVIGDICGIISGSIGATLALYISSLGMNITLSSVLTAAAISTITVGGKAAAKELAQKKCDEITFIMGKARSRFTRKK